MQADIGLVGLAVMGQNLVLNMNDHGYTVCVQRKRHRRLAGRPKICNIGAYS
jgi:6-phosphogluconate dehydrogenase